MWVNPANSCINFADAMKNHNRINSQTCVPSRFCQNRETMLPCADQRRQRSAAQGDMSLMASRRSALKPGACLRSRFGSRRKQMESPDISLSSFMEDCLNRLAAVAKHEPPTRSRCSVRNCQKIHSPYLARAPDNHCW